MKNILSKENTTDNNNNPRKQISSIIISIFLLSTIIIPLITIGYSKCEDTSITMEHIEASDKFNDSLDSLIYTITSKLNITRQRCNCLEHQRKIIPKEIPTESPNVSNVYE